MIAKIFKNAMQFGEYVRKWTNLALIAVIWCYSYS